MPKDWVLNKVKISGLLGKLYINGEYVCTHYGADLLNTLNAELFRYLPLGPNVSVSDNLIWNNRVSSTQYQGWNAFYMTYKERGENGRIQGHFGFVYIDGDITIIVHNG